MNAPMALADLDATRVSQKNLHADLVRQLQALSGSVERVDSRHATVVDHRQPGVLTKAEHDHVLLGSAVVKAMLVPTLR